MINVGVAGLGKMGLSHLALFGAHPDARVTGACDTATYTLGVLGKYTGVPTYSDFDSMLSTADLDAVVIATPSDLHVPMVQKALGAGLHIFCEKPLTLDPDDAELLVGLAENQGLITQVGYHNRFIATFAEVGNLIKAGAIGDVTHILGEAYGPVVLKVKGSTWRSRGNSGGGCLYDYAAHVINLINWYCGEPSSVSGSVLPKVFSREVEDGAFSTFHFESGMTGQISVNWSDESQRKMSTKITIWGTRGRITVDRQECRAYISSNVTQAPDGYERGWNVRYTTDLTKPVAFYLRGEEYSAQVEAFIERVAGTSATNVNDFKSAATTDATIAMVAADAKSGPRSTKEKPSAPAATGPLARWLPARAST